MDLLLGWLQSGLGHIGPFLILLGLLIFVHELGHFLVAKYYGVRVEVFSLGFGKKIFQFQKGDTNYCVSLIPLGGYVKMFGDDPTAQLSESEKKFSFLHKPVGQRIAIVLAGPLMNLFFAMFLYAVIAMVGEQVPSPILGDIHKDSAAYAAGFRSGDHILSINDQHPQSWTEVVRQIESHPNHPLTFTIQPENKAETHQLEVEPQLKPNENIFSTKAKVGQVGGLGIEALAPIVGVSDPMSHAAQAGLQTMDLVVSLNGHPIQYFRELEPLIKTHLESGHTEIQLEVRQYSDNTEAPLRTIHIDAPFSVLDAETSLLSQLGLESAEMYLMAVNEDSPAAQAGLKEGDRILFINGQPMASWMDVVETVKNYQPDEGNITFNVLRAGQEVQVTVQPEMTTLMNMQGQDENRFTVGIRSAYIHTTAAPTLRKTANPIEASWIGINRSLEMSGLVVMGIVRLVQGEISSRNVGGVITIGRFASRSFRVGLTSFLTMMAFISINLFLVNLLPVPILDGGHLVFFTIEAIRGAPLSMRKMIIAQQVGLVILMSLMAFALFNDITNLFNPPW